MSGWQQQQGGWQQQQGAGQRAPGYGQQAQGQYAYGDQQTGPGGYQQQQQYGSAQPTAQAGQASYGQQAGEYGASYQQQAQGGYQAPSQQAGAYGQRPGGGAAAPAATGYGQQAPSAATTGYGAQGSYGQAATAQPSGSAYAAPADPRRAVTSTTYPSAQPQAAAAAPAQAQQTAYGGYAAQAPAAATAAPAAATAGYGQAAGGYGAAAAQPAATSGYQAQGGYGAAAATTTTQPAQQWGQQAPAAAAQPAATGYGTTAGYSAPAAAQPTAYAPAGAQQQGYGAAAQQQQGYGAAAQQQGYGTAAAQQQGYGAAAAQQLGYGAAAAQQQGYGSATATAAAGGGSWGGAAAARPATGAGGFVAAQSSDYAGAAKPAAATGGYSAGYGAQAGGQQAAARPGYGAPAGGPAGGYGGRPGGPSQPGGYVSSPSRPTQPGGYGGAGAPAAGGGGRFGQATVSAPYREQQQQRASSSMPGFTPAGQGPSQPRVPGYTIQPPKHRADDRPRVARSDVHLHPPPPPPPGGVIPGKPPAPVREERREERPRSPVRRRSPSLDRPAPYGVRIPSHILSQSSTEYREVERRHAKLYMAHDFTKVVNCCAQAPASADALAGALLPLERPCPMDHLTAPAKQDTTYDLDHRNVAPRGSVVYNARVVFTPGLNPSDRTALLKGAHDKAGEHLSRLLKFVVARADRNGDKSGIFCLGGRCDPAVDGDPAAGDAALVAAAVRHVAAQTQLDLSGAAFKRFLEVHYTRLDRNDVEHHREVTVIFLADASGCLPSEAEWPAVWQRQKELHMARAAADRAAKKAAEQRKKEEAADKAAADKEGGDAKAADGKAEAAAEEEKEEPIPEPQMPAHPQLQLVGLHTDRLKLKTAAISLDGLLDYNTSDKDEGTFELSLFAEALHDALMRDAGAAILAELYKQRDAAVKRREERKRKRDSEAAEAAKKAKAEGGEAAAADASKDGKEASRDPSRSPAPASKEDKDKAQEEGKDKEKERPATRRVLANEQLCLAFRYLDKTGAGYIKTDDLRKLLDGLGLALHHTVVKELALNVSDASGRYRSERVHYMPLCEEEVPVEEPAAAVKPESAAEVKAEVKADPAAAAEPKQEGDGKPAAADLVPSFISVGGTPSATTAGGDTEMAEAAAAEDGAEGAAAAAAAHAEAAEAEEAAAAAAAPVATPEKQALAAEVEAMDVAGLVGRGKLASLTIAQLSKYCQLHGLATSGKKADIVARVTEHVQQGQ